MVPKRRDVHPICDIARAGTHQILPRDWEAASEGPLGRCRTVGDAHRQVILAAEIGWRFCEPPFKTSAKSLKSAKNCQS
jgi:hypothetical protein